MLTLSDYAVLALLLTQSSCYTLVGPKLYSQSLPASSRGWSNIVPYPFRAYQPSIPVQYYGRYFGDPYFAHNLQNPDYYFTQDPYSPSFEDPDYYSNFLYYIPADRRVSYYDPAIMDPLDEIQDYDEEPAEDNGISKSQREWWLEKDVAPNEDIDFGQINQIEDLYGKNAKASKKQKSKTKDSRKASPRNRYAGIDGFGRKKDKEQVFGNYRPNVRKEKERTWVYGVPSVRSEYEDRDVQELKSLLKDPNAEKQKFADTNLADWVSGNAKRSAGTVKNPEGKENSSTFKDKFVAALKPMKIMGLYSVYDEGGKEDMPEELAEESNWTSNYVPEETSVFDTIKKLLALEDKVNRVSQEVNAHKMLKRKQSKNREKERERPDQRGKFTRASSETTTTMRKFPNSDQRTLPIETTTKASVRTQQKRSTSGKQHAKSIYTDEDSLARQLSALRHRTS